MYRVVCFVGMCGVVLCCVEVKGLNGNKFLEFCDLLKIWLWGFDLLVCRIVVCGFKE